MKIGIIGGAGPLASSLLYEMIVSLSYQNALEIPEIHLLNYPFIRGLTPKEKNHHQEILKEQLRYCIETMKIHGIKKGIIACNTLHMYLPRNELIFPSLPEMVMRETEKQGAQKLLLLSSQNTCLSSLYDLSKIVCPKESEQNLVDQTINHILQGNIFQEDARILSQLIQRYHKDIDGVILGCTDLPVLHNRFPILTEKPLFDSLKIAAQKLIGLL